MGLTQPNAHIDPCLLQQGCAPPIYAGVWVNHGDEAAGNSRVYQRIGARRGLAVMAARFKGDIGRGSTRLSARDLQRDRFGMGTAAVLSRAIPDDHAVFDEDAANSRIVRRSSRLRRAEFKGAAHVVFVSGFKHSFS